MSALDTVDLQKLCNVNQCAYFVEAPIEDVNILITALRYPFMKLYALDSDKPKVLLVRQRFEQNSRIQIFLNTHKDSFFEVARMVPFAYPALFWLESTIMTGQYIEAIAQARPAKRDVIIVTSSAIAASGAFASMRRYFGGTHSIDISEIGSPAVVMLPTKH